MRALGIAVLLVGGCTFDPGAVDPGGGPPDGDLVDAHVPDGDEPGLATPPDLHRVPDGIAPGALGWPCGSAAECANGYCIDGYCCENPCDRDASTCQACNVPGQEGRCVFVLAGTDPRGQCDQDPPQSCGRDGLCDGKGHCRNWNAGTACGGSSCANGTVIYAPACDGTGNCVAGSSASCYPYVCANGSACATDCTLSPSECASGATCTNGICGKRSDGQPCNVAGDCQSNHCEESVCCASACSGTCFACNLPGKVGTCAPVPAGLDPLNQCTATSRTTCGLDGTCDGSGACRNWVAGTPCAGLTCLGDSVVSARSCDGMGNCQPPLSTTSCAPYTCNPGNATCFTSCTSNMECAQGHFCKTNKMKCQ